MGIEGEDWLLIYDWYQNLRSKVKWENCNSRSFAEEQGVRQGGILSPVLYEAYINPLLNWYENKHLGFRIGSSHVASPSCADDIVLLSDDTVELQVMLNLQEHFANKESYFISETKSKLMVFNEKKSDNREELYLHDKHILDLTEILKERTQ